MLPFVVGEAIGDVALLEDKVIVDDSGVVDGPGCGLGNDVPEDKKKHKIKLVIRGQLFLSCSPVKYLVII